MGAGDRAIAHFTLIAETLPADAELLLMSDPEGAFVSAEPVGFAAPLKDGRADLTFIRFNKELTNPKKRARVATFKRELETFVAQECDPSDDAATIRRAFIERHAVALDRRAMGVQADWWTVPIQTMYEPDKVVGIVYQRPIGTDDDRHRRQLELLDRSSLHAVDSAFNVLRQRVSYFHRAGMSPPSGSFYNAFQPYRPDMAPAGLPLLVPCGADQALRRRAKQLTPSRPIAKMSRLLGSGTCVVPGPGTCVISPVSIARTASLNPSTSSTAATNEFVPPWMLSS